MGNGVQVVLNKVITVIVNPLITLMFAVALVYFLFGVFQFVQNADSEDAREPGKQHIMWGIIGMFIMVAVFGIIRIVLDTFGITPPSIAQ